MGYSGKDVHPMLSLGCSAIGDAWTMFAQNIKEVEAYEESVAKGIIPIFKGHILTQEDLIMRRHVLNLMTRFETRWDSPETYTEYLEEIPAKLTEMVNDGLVELTPHAARITSKGIPFLRNICMAFDARLTRKSPNANLFSKTV
jgi:oxygen-independent coproporphyrinogen-3 oxidase